MTACSRGLSAGCFLVDFAMTEIPLCHIKNGNQEVLQDVVLQNVTVSCGAVKTIWKYFQNPGNRWS